MAIAETLQERAEGRLDQRKKSTIKNYLVKTNWADDAHFKEILTEDSVTQEDIEEELNEQKKHGYEWQHFLEKIITYTPFQICCLILAVIDVGIVIAVILIQLYVYKYRYEDALDVYTELVEYVGTKFNLPHDVTDLHQIMKLTVNYTCTDGGGGGGGEGVAPAPEPHHRKRSAFYGSLSAPVREKRSGGESVIHDSELVEHLHYCEHILHIVSVSILAFFTLMVFVKIAAEGLHFFKKVMEILDAIVVIVSFILDVLILSKVINPEAADAIIVILLLWQIVRIFNGIMLMEIQRLEMRVKMLKRKKKKVPTATLR